MIYFLLIIGYPLSEKKFWAKGDLGCLGFSLDITERERKCGIFRSKASLRTRKIQLLKGSKEPSLNQVQSDARSTQWVSQMCPWIRPFLAGLYSFFEKCVRENWQNRRLRIGNLWTFLKIPAFRHTEIFSRKSFKNRDLHRCVCGISFWKGSDKLGLWHWYRGAFS